MKPWMMVIMGTGPVRSGPGESANDGGVLIQEFIEHAQACGHEVTGAHFKVIAPDGSADEGSFDPLAAVPTPGAPLATSSAEPAPTPAAPAQDAGDIAAEGEADPAPQAGGDATG